MPFSHSFSEEFYYAEGDSDGSEIPNPNRPISVYQAVKGMSDDQWNELAREVFGIEPDFLDTEMVMEKILETDTVTDLRAPVEVWIDPDGDFRIDVYEKRKRKA
jgi:hypothetical protein